MSSTPRSGVTGGTDLATETLEFIATNWDTNNFDPQPILHHGDEGKQYDPTGGGTIDTLARNNDLRTNNIVTVNYEGRTTDPVGTEFDFDVEAEVDVTMQALTAEPAAIGDAVTWREFVDEVRRAILEGRHYPIVDPSCRYSYRWLTITDETDEPIEEDNRDWWNLSCSVSYFGYESLPEI